jgi:hypothetical protein
VLKQAYLLAKAAGFVRGQASMQTIDGACQELGIGDAVKEEAIATIDQRLAQLRFVFG